MDSILERISISVLSAGTKCCSHLAEVCHGNQPVEPDKPLEEIRQEEYSLPTGFEWDTLDIDQSDQVLSIAC